MQGPVCVAECHRGDSWVVASGIFRVDKNLHSRCVRFSQSRSLEPLEASRKTPVNGIKEAKVR
jgi:hypothetical protein